MSNQHRPRAVLGALAGVALAVTLITSPANAAQDKITRGEAQSHFDAFPTGGRVVLANGTSAAVGAGPASLFGAGIRPFPGSPWDGASYCENDWHVLLFALFDGGDSSYKRADAVGWISQVEIDWILDGTSLTGSKRTPVMRFNDPGAFGLETAFGAQDGVLMAPGSMSLGAHSLVADIIDPVFGDITLEITINIDASGTGTCV